MALQRANLSPRDREILDTLTNRVRVLSVAQVAAFWFAGAADAGRAAGRRLRALADRRLIEPFNMPARPTPCPAQPLTCWRPGEAEPDFGGLSRTLAQRWTEPAKQTACVIATAAAGTWLGGHGGRRPRRSEISHDLLLGQIYLDWRRTHPDLIASWLSEARLRRLGFGDEARLPDALVDHAGERCVVEVGGEYSPPKLAEFHEFCASRGLSYGLW